MCKEYIFLINLILFLTNCGLYSWSSPEVSMGHYMVPKVNLYGSISTHQGNVWENSQNITIDGKCKQIQMFFKPELLPSKNINTQTNKEEYTLQDDPNQYAQVKIDLEEVASIEAVPQLLYLYVGPKGNKNYPTQYVELIITLKDTKIKPYNCLVPESVKLTWDQKSNVGPVNSSIQIGSLKKLIFFGATTAEDLQKGK
jgi:hypothetical protein